MREKIASNLTTRLVTLMSWPLLLPVFVSALFQVVPLGALLIPPLETRFAAVALVPDETIDGIIALGGNPDRVVEAVKLTRRWPNARLIITGQGEERSHEYARANGITAQQLLLETKSRSTYENAVFSSQLVGPRADERWLIVTSPAHMPRAVGCFRKAGFAVLPWPVTPAPMTYSVSIQTAQHEWIGLLAYRLLGRTDAVFPGPTARPQPWSIGSLGPEAGGERRTAAPRKAL